MSDKKASSGLRIARALLCFWLVSAWRVQAALGGRRPRRCITCAVRNLELFSEGGGWRLWGLLHLHRLQPDSWEQLVPP